MAETRRKFDADFKEGAVRLVRETGRPIAQVAKDLGTADAAACRGDRLYRTGSGWPAGRRIRACGNGEAAPWLGMPER